MVQSEAHMCFGERGVTSARGGRQRGGRKEQSGRGTAMAKAWLQKGVLPAWSQDQISVAVPSYETGRCQHMDKHPFVR